MLGERYNMTLSASERARLVAAEETIADLAQLVKGAGSKNQLNRLLILAQEQCRQLSSIVETLETQVQELLELARKLQ
jgi:archaellum component FlaC